MPTTWLVEQTANPRFPYRVAIEQDGRTVLAVRAQAGWPGPGQQIFCLREQALDPAEPLELVERVPVVQLTRVGRKLTVTLDRAQRKRCEFLTVQKQRKDGSGSYEQVFFRTQSAIRAHRSRSRVELRAPPPPFTVVIDSAERYPWRFVGAEVQRRRLPVGDYGLFVGERLQAVVERKSFDNLLTDIGSIQVFHQQLADLASAPAAALVIEADYRDFLDPARLRGRWPAAHLARVLGELTALHLTLPIVYAGNRKLANDWARSFFVALASRGAGEDSQLLLDVARAYDAMPRGATIDEQVRRAALHELEQPFALGDLVAKFPDVPVARVRRQLERLKQEGMIRRIGVGRGTRWERVTTQLHPIAPLT
jgi:ERCC4-type nuclease